MPKLAIIGAGIMGANHGRVAGNIRELEVTAVCDPDLDRATALATSIGAKATTSLDEAIDLAGAVVLAAPSHLHGDMGAKVLNAGRDLLIEKPIATTVEEARNLIALAEANKRVLMVGHVERFNPAVIELLHLVEDPIAVEISRVGPFPNRMLADVVLDLMIHDVDLARAIVRSDISEVRGMSREVLTGEADHTHALLRFDNGVVASLTASRIGQNKVRKITVTQRENCIIVDLLRQQVEIHRIEHSEYLSEGGVRYRQSGFVELPTLRTSGEPLALELRHFAECVIERKRPNVTGEDGLAALETCLAIRDTK